MCQEALPRLRWRSVATCQLLAQDPNATIIEEVDAENFAINLGFTPEGWMSRLFGGMSYVLFKVVSAAQY